jgi:Transglutaminase-like superfamily
LPVDFSGRHFEFGPFRSSPRGDARYESKPMERRLRIPVICDVFLFGQVFLFAAAVPHLMRLKLARLASLIEPGSDPRPVDPDLVRKISIYTNRAIRRGKPFVRPGCLTLGLTRYYFFRRAGMDVSLHFGMGRIGKDKEFAGHCWLTRGGEPYLETVDPRPLYVEMYRISREQIRRSAIVGTGGLGRLTNS